MIALILGLALSLALALSLVLALTLPRRVAQIVVAERSYRERQVEAEAEASLLAALRGLLAQHPRSPEPPPQTRSPETPLTPPLETIRRGDPGKPLTPGRHPASRERPTPRAVTPPGSARTLPPEPGIVAARLGPRPEGAWSRHRVEPPPRAVALAQTMPSMQAVEASGARPPPRVDVEERPPEDEAS